MEDSKRKDIENFVRGLYEDGSSPCEAFGMTREQLEEFEIDTEQAKERMKQYADKTRDKFRRQLQVPYPDDNGE